jgi:calcineurin-like phosphoesterase family protein
MHKNMQDNWNNAVTDISKNFILGDFCFGDRDKIREMRNHLLGRITLIKGNHDKSIPAMIDCGFDEVYNELVIETVFGPTLLTHIPASDFKGCKVNFNGHVHEKWKFHKRSDGNIHVNVGVDQWQFKPISDIQIKEELDKWLSTSQ